jgi:7-cyano-7-deazaguanine synthase in queuosine biosynthesis
MNNKKKEIAIAFSGGMDSVALTLYNLNLGNNVTLLRFEIINNWSKAALERKACEKIIEHLRKKYPHQNIHVQECGSVGLLSSGLALPQAAIWAFMLGSTSLNYVDEVQVGYILNDCAVSYMEEIKKLYKSIEAFKSQKMPSLSFPFIKKHKQDVYNMLDYDLSRMTVTCEQPITKDLTEEQYLSFKHKANWSFLADLEIKECGHCETCTKKKNMFGESLLFNSYKEEDREKDLGLEISAVSSEEPVEQEFSEEKNYTEILA